MTPIRAMRRVLATALAVALVAAGAAPAAGGPGADPAAQRQWPQHGRDGGEQRYSPLSRIDAANVQRLGLAWSHAMREPRGVEATPIVVDGTMFVTGPWSVVYALDARTGRERWVHDPQVPRWKAAHACCDVVNRGVAVHEGRVYLGTLDGRLQALDARSGRLLWSQRTYPIEETRTITGAPRVAAGVVVIGHGGAEYGVRGFVSGHDARTGQRLWRFYTVPGHPEAGGDGEPSDRPLRELALPTWRGAWGRYGGGGTVWDSMAHDAALDLLYIGVGNGSPHNAALRSPGGGDNLFLSSVVAVRPRTGEYVWHYQTTPGDSWDYTATQHIVLADLDIDGRRRKVLLQAPKNGFFYVLDRTDGRLISAQPYTAVTWASHVDAATGRPVVDARARYEQAPALVQPSQLGGHNWQPMAFSPATGLVYVPAMESTAFMQRDAAFVFRPGTWNTGVADPPLLPDAALVAQARQAYRGFLLAWDPVAQREVWRVAHPGPWNGGVLATAGGLVFQGHNGGEFAAYDARSGRKLWSQPLGLHALGGPVSYELDGEQYVAVAAGFGSSMHLAGGLMLPEPTPARPGRVFVFKLGGRAALPEVPPAATATAAPAQPAPSPPSALPAAGGDGAAAPAGEDARAAAVMRGGALYARYCAQCHGGGGISAGVLPDLRRSPYLADAALFRGPPLEGVLAARGMPRLAPWLDAADVEAVRQYVIAMAGVTIAPPAQAGPVRAQP